MSKSDMGGPAFPVPNSANVNGQEGMTLWDYYAAAALNGILSGPCSRDGVPAKEWFDAPEFAGKLADAMLAERAKRQDSHDE